MRWKDFYIEDNLVKEAEEDFLLNPGETLVNFGQKNVRKLNEHAEAEDCTPQELAGALLDWAIQRLEEAGSWAALTGRAPRGCILATTNQAR